MEQIILTIIQTVINIEKYIFPTFIILSILSTFGCIIYSYKFFTVPKEKTILRKWYLKRLLFRVISLLLLCLISILFSLFLGMLSSGGGPVTIPSFRSFNTPMAFSAEIKTRNVQEVAEKVKLNIINNSGEIDREDTVEHNLYTFFTFALPKKNLEIFLAEIKTYTYEKLYTVSIETTNAYSQYRYREENNELANISTLPPELQAGAANKIYEQKRYLENPEIVEGHVSILHISYLDLFDVYSPIGWHWIIYIGVLFSVFGYIVRNIILNHKIEKTLLLEQEPPEVN